MDCEEIENRHPGALDDISLEIAEHLWDRDRTSPLEEGEDGYVWVSDIQAQNATNHEVTGSFWLGGVEYSFRAECGDRNGWVWRFISADESIPDIEIHHTKWALAPNRDLVTQALSDGRGAFLIAKWEALIAREPCKSIPSKYSYDRHFQPGLMVESHWKGKAAEFGFVLVDEETAEEIRRRLKEAGS